MPHMCETLVRHIKMNSDHPLVRLCGCDVYLHCKKCFGMPVYMHKNYKNSTTEPYRFPKTKKKRIVNKWKKKFRREVKTKEAMIFSFGVVTHLKNASMFFDVPE